MPSRLRLAAPVLALALLAAACSDGEPAPGSGTPAATAASAATTPAAAPSADPSAPASNVVDIKVTITGSKVSPRPSTRKVAKGAEVRIEVTGDQADELHVHGYDLPADIKPGTPAVLEFKADRTGVFEVETHESGLLLFKLQVS